MQDSGTVIASNMAEYCKDITVEISNDTGIKHIYLKDIYTVAEIENYDGSDKRANGEHICMIIIKTNLATSNEYHKLLDENSDMVIGKISTTFNIKNEDTGSYDEQTIVSDKFNKIRSVEKLFLGPDTVSMCIKLAE